MKYFFTFILINLLILGRVAICDDSEFLRSLKENPDASPEAARWFAKLPAKKKREYATKIGKIVLEADMGTEDENIAVAVGSDKSPYPWVFVARKNSLQLYGDNRFQYILRDDKWVKHQWGVYWDARQSYRNRNTKEGIIFDKASGRYNQFDLWIPATSWRYVGPKLPKSDSILGKPDSPPS